MIFQRLFAPRPGVVVARTLFAGAIAKARDPEIFLGGAAPDTAQGRFEVLALHVILLVRRLTGADPEMADLRQGVFDAFVRNLDDGLREMGVGDLSVGKKMRKLAQAFYGRLKTVDAAFAAPAPEAALAALVARTVFADVGDGAFAAAPLAAYLIRAEAALAATPTERFFRGEAPWPTFRS
jgi:cytochrome b pre-mRNA-processing protein 3